MKVGYMRVSTDDQDVAMQEVALLRAGCERLYADKISGKTTSRPQLDLMLRELRAGDTLVVWKLDRLGRTTVHLIGLIEELSRKGIEFRSVTENFDTTTPMGRAMVGIMAVFAQLEREVIQERIRAGVKRAMSERDSWGRKVDKERDARCAELARGGMSYSDIASAVGLRSKSTVCESIRRYQGVAA